MFKQFVMRLFSEKRPILGRWCLHDKSKNHWKIDMANIDHCGTCVVTQEKTTDEHCKKEKNEK